jgi:hypothetical protein
LRYDHLVAMSRSLDAAIPGRAVVLGDIGVNNLIPAMSAKAVLVSFRSAAQTTLHGGFSIEEARRRKDLHRRLVAGSLPAEESVRLLEEFGVQLVLSAHGAPWLQRIPGDLLRREKIAQAGPLELYRIALTDRPGARDVYGALSGRR